MSAMPIPTSLQKSIDSTSASYIQLGKSGLRVSLPILGCMSIGSSKWAHQGPFTLDEADGIQLLSAAWDRGITTWDTANVYSSGESERIIGAAIKTLNIPREKLTILTKVMGIVPESPEVFSWMYEKEMRQTKDYVNQGGLSRGAIFKAVDASLKRLGTEYIDLLQIHRFDPTVPIEETMKALHDLVQLGKVNYIGASSMWTYQFAWMQFVAEKNGWTKFISMQNRYNLLYREEEREMVKFCKDTGVGIIPWGPLYHGLLATPLDKQTARASTAVKMLGGLTDADKGIIGRVKEIADKKSWKMSHVAMAWLKAKGAVPIVGLSSLKAERLDDACKLRDLDLDDEEVRYLEEPYISKPVVGHM